MGEGARFPGCAHSGFRTPGLGFRFTGKNISALVPDNASVMHKMRAEVEKKPGILTSPCCYHILDSIGGAILSHARFQVVTSSASTICCQVTSYLMLGYLSRFIEKGYCLY